MSESYYLYAFGDASDQGFQRAVMLWMGARAGAAHLAQAEQGRLEFHLPLGVGIEPRDGSESETDSRKIWRLFAQNYHLFAGTPSRIWLDHVFNEVFGLDDLLAETNADEYLDHINESLARPEFRPRALFDRFNIEVLATTESPLDSLER